MQKYTIQKNVAIRQQPADELSKTNCQRVTDEKGQRPIGLIGHQVGGEIEGVEKCQQVVDQLEKLRKKVVFLHPKKAFHVQELYKPFYGT